MSFWKEAGKFVGNAIPFVGPLINKATDKVFGVPTPPTVSGAEAGGMHRDFLNNAYPGTTPWEQLGATGNMGNTSAPEVAARSAERLQRRELQNRSEIADKTNLAHVISSGAGTSPMAVKTLMDAYRFGTVNGDYDTKTRQDRERLPFESSKLDAESKLTSSKITEQETRGDIFKNLGMVLGSARNFGVSVGSGYAKHINDVENFKREFEASRGKVPPRFKRQYV